MGLAVGLPVSGPASHRSVPSRGNHRGPGGVLKVVKTIKVMKGRGKPTMAKQEIV
ncbi:hypothetical protein GCM10014715_35110 [Streptomyces spiralis]|uniref:Uncharacterized protein n=1 Tax=Streptomyces spiralis TaxID=66376 RepID=A0A919DTN0_9ACTN|nr:hypothetical protein GCM10014715_35110 [Streptomyces spiralis]